jgi:hypothetical protein
VSSFKSYISDEGIINEVVLVNSVAGIATRYFQNKVE